KGTQEIMDALSPLQFLEIVETKSGIVVVNVERRDIQKNPYLFSITYLYPDRIEIIYSYNPEESPKKRRLEILRYFINLVTLLENVYFINHKQLYQLIDNFMSRLLEYTSSTYEELFSKYDAVKEECERVKKQLAETILANESLRKANIELKEKQNELLLRIKELETVSDEVLISRIQTWLDEHNYEINISDFARINKVSEQRVEEILNKMIREGYISQRE
ncbi:MAG: hypothetical protein NZ903_01950, partial [Candidatus Micrarchaeota archaeon]|nr:hypothetical protein [Candidatus Micrarchaeota archaeon]